VPDFDDSGWETAVSQPESSKSGLFHAQ